MCADGGYHAFPHVVAVPGGDLLVAYRSGTTHLRDNGVLVARRSTDGGVTWSDPWVLAEDAHADLRDPCLAVLPDGRLALTWFVYQPLSGRGYPHGVRVAVSEDGGASFVLPSVVRDGFDDWSACCGPLVSGASGEWLVPTYGRNRGDRFDSAVVAASTDEGRSWERTGTLLHGPAARWHGQEPNLVPRLDAAPVALVRVEGPGEPRQRWLALATPQPGGSAEGWAVPEPVLDGGGAPHVTVLADGSWLLAYRGLDVSGGIDGPTLIARSADGGRTWGPPVAVDHGACMYAAAVEIEPGTVLVVYAQEPPGANGNAGQVADVRWWRGLLPPLPA